MLQEKKCSNCKEFKDLDKFHYMSGNKFARLGHCKACVKARNKKKYDERKKAYENWF